MAIASLVQERRGFRGTNNVALLHTPRRQVLERRQPVGRFAGPVPHRPAGLAEDRYKVLLALR